MLEGKLEAKLVKKIEALGGQALKLNTGKRGMPDRVILLPPGRTIFVEMKAPGEKPRPLQKKRLRDLTFLGFRTEVIDSEESLQSFIEDVVL